jgi:hypothetical protein
MKNIIILFSFLAVLSSCSKSNKNSNKDVNNKNLVTAENIVSIENVKSVLQSYHKKDNSEQKRPNWGKIKKWIKAHVGAQTGVYCPGGYACGPCPGICIFTSKTSQVVPDNYILSDEDINDDQRLFILSNSTTDSTTYIITFVNTDDFVLNNQFVISENADLGSNVANEFGKESFVIKSGTYPVIYDFDQRGETVITIVE